MRLIPRLLAFTALSAFTTLAVADKPSIPLNTITMNLSAEKWVNAESAKVSVAVNAALTSQQLATFQDEVKMNLQKLAKSDNWHIIDFQQSKDQSGLESVRVIAQARLPANSLANLNTQAKALSQQGSHYEIIGVEFTPSFTQIQQTNSQLRQALYGKVKDELAIINQTYAPQSFHVYDIQFQNNIAPTQQYKPAGLVLTRMANSAVSNDQAQAEGVAVSKKITLTAKVQFASADQLPVMHDDD